MRSVNIPLWAVAVAGAVLSYGTLQHLGELAGYGRLSVLFPIVVDAGTAASTAAWFATKRRQAGVMTVTLFIVSIVLNSTTHYLSATHTAPSWWLISAVAALPPAVLASCIHLAVSLKDVTAGPELAVQALEDLVPGDGPADVDEHEQVSAADPLLDQARALAVEYGRLPGRPLLRERLGVSDWKARQLAEALSSTNGTGPADV